MTDVTAYGLSRRTASVLGLAYLVIGVGLGVGLWTGSFDLLIAVFAGVVGITIVSLAVIVRHEGLVTPENKLIGGFVALALALGFALAGLTDLPDEVVFAVVFAVGVIIPHVVLRRR